MYRQLGQISSLFTHSNPLQSTWCHVILQPTKFRQTSNRIDTATLSKLDIQTPVFQTVFVWLVGIRNSQITTTKNVPMCSLWRLVMWVCSIDCSYVQAEHSDGWDYFLVNFVGRRIIRASSLSKFIWVLRVHIASRPIFRSKLCLLPIILFCRLGEYLFFSSVLASVSQSILRLLGKNSRWYIFRIHHPICSEGHICRSDKPGLHFQIYRLKWRYATAS